MKQWSPQCAANRSNLCNLSVVWNVVHAKVIWHPRGYNSWLDEVPSPKKNSNFM